jgi:hypothetical protein
VQQANTPVPARNRPSSEHQQNSNKLRPIDPTYPEPFFSFQTLEDGCELGVWGSKVKIVVENILESVGWLLRALGRDIMITTHENYRLFGSCLFHTKVVS